MDNMDVLRKKRMEEIKNQYTEQMQEQAKAEQQIQQLELIAKQVLTKEALQRYSNLKTAFPEKAIQLLIILAQAIQSRNVSKIDDSTLKELLRKLEPKKKEMKIKRA